MPGTDGQPTTSARDRRRNRPWWQWTIRGFVALLILGAIVGGGDADTAGTTTTTTTTATLPAQPAETATTPADAPATIADARQAADADDYAQATAIAAQLGTAAQDAIRRRIANRIARRALNALRAGDRGAARRLVIGAARYATTALTRQARASYRAAKARAAARARARAGRRAAEQAAAEAARAEAEQSAPAPAAPADTGGSCDPNYEGACLDPASSDYDCEGGSGNGPDYTGPVRVVGSDPFDLDRDGDGAACE